MAIRLNLDLLGPFRLTSETELALSSRKAQALIAYLAVPAGQAHSRDKLAGLLWGDRGDQAARHSLRQTLSSIRRVMKSAEIKLLTSTADIIALDPSTIDVDVDRLERLAAEDTPEALMEATALYRGDFLEGIRVSGSQFEEWLTFERGRLRDLARHACLKLFELQTQAAKFELATETGRRLLAFDPLHEDIHRSLMRLYAASGQRGLALRQYETCRRVLAEELDLEPEEETEQLLRDIRQLRPEELSRLIVIPESTETATESRSEPPPATATVASAGTVIPSDLQLPDKPSIAVLPFTNLSDDPGQEYFSDGITEEVTAALARNRWLLVVARNSSFVYKGKAADVRQIGRELGVRYVVEGSVRKDNDQVRTTAQLVDTSDGSRLWGERYDRTLDSIFAVQDEIAGTIAASIEPELASIESERARAKRPENLNAWDCYQRGLWHMYKFTLEGLSEAGELFKRAADMDPGFAPAHARLAYVHIQNFWYGPHESRVDAANDALAAAHKAVAVDDRDSLGHFALGRAYALQGLHDLGIPELERAIELNPSFAQAYFGLGQALVYAGRSQEALQPLADAIRLSPNDPHLWTFLHVQALAYYHLNQLSDAENWATKALQQPNTTHWPFATLVSILGVANRAREAAPFVRQLLRRKPEYSCAYARADFSFGERKDFIDRYVAGLRNAGVPEDSAEPAWDAAVHVPSDGIASSNLELPDKPSIAVRPFDNVNGDPEREYVSDGITADIITGLSQLPSLFVIAPSTSFAFRGQSASAQQAATQLGVRYILDGSVRKSGIRLHVTAQLNDGSTGEQVWKKRFDGQVEGIFELEAELIESIVGAIVPERGAGEIQRAKSKTPNNMEALDRCQQAIWYQYRYTKEDLAKALQLFRGAAELEPNLVRALVGSVDVQYHQVASGLADSVAQCRDEAIATARRAVELNPDCAAARCALGTAHIIRREHDAAIPELETAIELSPSFAWAHYGLGAAHVFSGRARDAIPHVESAMRLSPRDQHMGSFLARMADARLLLRQYDEAVESAKKALRQPLFEWSGYATLLSALGHLGRLDEARRVLDELLRHKDDFTLEFVRQTHLFTGLVTLEFVDETQLFTDQDEFAHYIDGIRKAGVATGLDTL